MISSNFELEDISFSSTDQNVINLGSRLSVSDDGSIIAVGTSSRDYEKPGSLRLFKLKNNTWVEFNDQISSRTVLSTSDGSIGGGGGSLSFDLSGNGFF